MYLGLEFQHIALEGNSSVHPNIQSADNQEQRENLKNRGKNVPTEEQGEALQQI